MIKFGEDPGGQKVLDEFRKKLDADEVQYAMLAYVDKATGEMFMFGDGHSVTVIVSNIVMNAVHNHLHEEEQNYQARKTMSGHEGLEGFIPDDTPGS